MECSAKLDSGVEQLFLKGAEIMVARRLVQHVKFEELRVSQELERKKKTVSNCC
jgi:predicted RNA-binding protein with PIN domain